MQTNIRVSFLWMCLSLCFLLHNVYHLAELFFGIDIKLPDAKGEVPITIHLFRIVVELVVLIMFLWSLYAKSKTFYVISYVWAVLLGVLNIVHLGGTVLSEINEYSQIALLAFIIVCNVLLIKDSHRRWKELKNTEQLNTQ